MKKLNLLSWMFAMLMLFSLTSCDKDDVEDPDKGDESEVITTIKLTYTNTANAADKVEVSFKASQGLGGGAQASTINLGANKSYDVNIQLLNESNPAKVEDIGKEVLEEAHEHQFFFVPTGVNLTVTPTDKDKNNLPLGLITRQVTGAASSGKLRVVLKHMPGLKNANSTINTGDTDVDVNFNVNIQ